nr:YbaK/EbsC family protein [bacterium]
MDLEHTIYQTLDSLHIPYVVERHRPVYTMEDAAAIRSQLMDVPHCKNLFVEPVRRAEGRKFLYVLQEHKRADLRYTGQQIGTTKLQLLKPDVLMDMLGVIPGAVSPLALVHPGARPITVLIDRDVMGQDKVCFHPGINTASLCLSTADFKRYLDFVGNPVVLVDAPQPEQAP